VSDAVVAAADAQEALRDGPVRVRMGVHTGEPLVTDEGYVGVDVHRGARVMSAGHGGQVLISETMRRLVDARFQLRDLGPQRLKDLTEPQRLYQLGDDEFPPLKTLNQTNLPVAASALVGRDSELAELVGLLQNGSRVVTVTGPGGSGKTRLALQAAAELVDDFRDGVFWIPLAGVEDHELVLPAIGEVIGAGPDVKTHLARKQTLLLLDNFEHLLDAASSLADLLERAEHLRVLATSRAPLRIAGEHEYPLEPMSEDDAVRFFVERAAAAGRRLVADDVVAEICRRLDSLPLAIELAAARAKLLAPDALLDRLDRRLPVLTGGRRDAPARQRTLRATIDWSYDLLDENAKRLFAQLSIFSGDFALDAAEEICAADLEGLAALVDLSLLKPVGSDRFVMLETIREYAGEQLDAMEAEELKRRHAEHYLAVAEAAHLAAETAEQQRPEVARAEQWQLRGALDWAVIADPALGLRIAVALEQFWQTQTPVEGRARIAALLEHVGDPALRARGLRVLGGISIYCGDVEAARELYDQALELYRSLDDAWGVSHMLMRFAHDAANRGARDEAVALADQSLELSRAHGFARNEIHILTLQGGLELEDGDEDRGVALMEEAIARARAVGFVWWEMVTLNHVAGKLLVRRNPRRAAPYALRVFELAERTGDRGMICATLVQFARFAAFFGDARRAGRLWGVVEAEVEREPVPGWVPEETQHTDAILALRGPEFDRGVAEGRRLTLADAVAEVRATPAFIN
jgi:predicted ATPase